MTFQINSTFTSASKGTPFTNFQSNTSAASQSKATIISESKLNELAQAAETTNLLENAGSVGRQIADDLINNRELNQISEQQGESEEDRGTAIGYSEDRQQEDAILRVEESGQPEGRQGQLGDRGMQSILHGIEGGPINVQEEFGIIREAPHGSYLEGHAKKGQSEANKTPNPAYTAVEKARELVTDVVKDGWNTGVEHGAGNSEHDDASMLYQAGRVLVAATAGAIVGGPVSIMSAAGLAGMGVAAGVYKVLGWLGDLADQAQQARRERIANANKIEDPLKDPIDQNDLVGTRDYDLKMQILKNYNPVVDPSEESAGREIHKIIEDLNVIEEMDLFHGGTSTGSFQEEGTIRLDQSDFTGFLGSNGGTSTGGDQII